MDYNPAKTTIASEVLPFSPDNLAYALSNADCTTPATLREKMQFRFFCAYLGADASEDGLAAQTMLVEEPYVSDSYLADYADYYVRGFSEYARFCKRVHFFALRFDREEFDQALTSGKPQALWDSYLGYIVSKPLPGTPIGATLLRPYPHTEAKRRHYPAQRPYLVNVLGKQLTINTLVFQEQDTNVAACATIALWVAFHKTSYLFQTPLPTLYQLTASTGNSYTLSGRSFPNTFLTRQQIGNAVEKVGLVLEDLVGKTPDVLRAYAREQAQAERQGLAENWAASQDAGQPDELLAPENWPTEAELTQLYLHDLTLEQLGQVKGFVYAYLRMGLPVLLFLNFTSGIRHLVTVTGYREAAPASQLSSPAITLLSASIERFYAHDDQIGPFARLGFTPEGLLETSWPQPNNSQQRQQAVVERVSVPLIRDIRIQYDQVYAQTALLDAVFYELLKTNQNFVWDIYLSYSNHYKQALLDQPPTTPTHLRRITSRLLPKYVWVARATLNGRYNVVADLVFDATDLHTGFYCLLTNLYGTFREALGRLFSIDENRAAICELYGFNERYLALLLHDLRD